MAQHVEKFAVLAPANTPAVSSIATAVTFPPGVITAVDVKIPGGHSRKTGLQLFYGEIQLIPRTSGQYLRGNKVRHRFEFEELFAGGSGWVTDVFNTGQYDHTFELYLEVIDTADALALLPPVLLLRQSGESFDGAPAPGIGPTPIPGPGGTVPVL